MVMEATVHQRPMGRVTAMEGIPVENGTDTIDTFSLFCPNCGYQCVYLFHIANALFCIRTVNK